eukprot:TRINITY_DN43753_c0_g1_i1.p1 TRINITY_DN43753_c0_g1~~TRINITY_DN43753_c0_g1_i1.p1  ORF type:complete len:599 (+),score=101.99 TRINITY_DN43753_c0_g1_i1:47-1843(+)
MARRAVVVAALEGILQRARAPELAEIALSETVVSLQTAAVETLELIGGNRAGAKEIVESIAAVSKCCIAVGEEVGLSSSALVAELVSESLVAASLLFASEEEECSQDDAGLDRLKFEHKAGVARFLEPLGEALDSFVLEIYETLRRLEDGLQVRWNFRDGGRGGYLALGSTTTASDLQLYEALQALCACALSLVARAVGYRQFSSKSLWEFASEDGLCALVFVKGALCFRQGDWDPQTTCHAPEDLPDLRDTVMGAALGLTGQDIAFSTCDNGGNNIDISSRNEWLALHRATLAAAAGESGILDCLLAYPWLDGLMGADRLPALVSFLNCLMDSVNIPRWSQFLVTLGEQVDALRERLASRQAELWNVLAPLAVPKRGFLRDCASLAFVAPPSSEQCGALLSSCLSSGAGDLEAVISDSEALAALVVFASNSGFSPGNDVLSAVLSHLEYPARAHVVGRLHSWRGPSRVELLSVWMEWLAVPAHDVPPEESHDEVAPTESQATPATAVTTGRTSLRDLLISVPPQLCCSIDGRMLVDPVRSPFGHVYERAILARTLLQTGGICPITGSLLKLDECPRDTEMRKEVFKWVRTSQARKRD